MPDQLIEQWYLWNVCMSSLLGANALSTWMTQVSLG